MIEPIKRAVKFTANDEYSKLIVPKGQKKTDLQASIAGGLTGILSLLTLMPILYYPFNKRNHSFEALVVLQFAIPACYLAELSLIILGMTESMVIAPFEVVKVRLQVVNRLSQYKNTFDCAKKVILFFSPF